MKRKYKGAQFTRARKRITENINNKISSKRIIKESVNKFKDFEDVKIGDVGIDYNDEPVTILDKGTFREMEKYDYDGLAHEWEEEYYEFSDNPTDFYKEPYVWIDSKDFGRNMLFYYGDGGVLVPVENNKTNENRNNSVRRNNRIYESVDEQYQNYSNELTNELFYTLQQNEAANNIGYVNIFANPNSYKNFSVDISIYAKSDNFCSSLFRYEVDNNKVIGKLQTSSYGTINLDRTGKNGSYIDVLITTGRMIDDINIKNKIESIVLKLKEFAIELGLHTY